ncbi:uncharacterized protein C8R40DRAFT_1116938 [Lentinula edodes]|uniref:uncharacterized protein n=1 Tax=Lentinula edodes TaxID=5353 RepID=UPI001E8E6AA0|nr:uncharacterized protein C8R40DRAFT_1116938 [Lentinula edodes]KAH7872466.1 hypothetical protein C8R40DRAFT_1116938 [Lentinula edodes]
MFHARCHQKKSRSLLPADLVYKNYMSRVYMEVINHGTCMVGGISEKKVGQSHPGLATIESDEEASKQAIVLDRNSFAVFVWGKPRHMLLKLSTYSLPPMQLQQTHT